MLVLDSPFTDGAATIATPANGGGLYLAIEHGPQKGCGNYLSAEQGIELRDWLNERLPIPGETPAEPAVDVWYPWG